MFDPQIFDNIIFDTPTVSFHFGRGGRKFERGLFNPVFLSIPIIGIATRLHTLIHTVLGIPFRRIKTPLLAHGVSYRTFNIMAQIKRKRRFTMLEMEMLET